MIPINQKYLTKQTDTEDENWLLDRSSHCDADGETPSQFSLICDNVQLDVAGRRSLLGDLGRILQNVLGLLA